MSKHDDAVLTEIRYTARDARHEYEKPYEMRYDTGGVIPTTNTTHESHTVTILNFRSFQNEHNFSDYGFAVEKMGTIMTDEVFGNRKLIQEVYYPVLEKLLWQQFPSAAEVRILEYNLRSRHIQYPHFNHKVELEFSQPATLAHIDYSLESAIRNACAVFKTPRESLKRVLTVNFWKSFQPGNDWPLALCDARSLNHDTDTIDVDIVYHDRYTENETMYYDPGHDWYYVKDLGEDEILMFVQKDTDKPGGGGVAHTSFYNPLAKEDAPPRMSIEIRAYVAFK